MMVDQQRNQEQDEDVLGPLQIRIQEIQRILTGEQTVVDALSTVAENRQKLLSGGLSTSGLIAGELEQDEFDLPKNVVVAKGAAPDEEALQIAREAAPRHRQIRIEDNGVVKALNPDGGGGSVKLREAQVEDFTIDRRIDPKSADDGSTSFTNPVRSMSDAAAEKLSRKGVQQ